MKKTAVIVSAFTALAGVSAFADATPVNPSATSVTLAEDKEYYLTGNTTKVTTFKMESGSVLDLKGFNFSSSAQYGGHLAIDANTMITNSESAAATVSITAQSAFNQDWYPFQNVVFGGNIALHVKGKSGKEYKGFLGVANTHTGGTTLESYRGENESAGSVTTKTPRFNSADAFGQKALTLKGGSHLNYIGSSDITTPWTALASELSDGQTACTNIIDNSSDKNFKITGAVDVAADSVLAVRYNNNIGYRHIWLEGPLAGVHGTLLVADSTANSRVYLDNTDGMPDGTLALASGTQVWINKAEKDETYQIGALETTGDIVAENDAKLVYVKNLRLNLRVGNEKDTTFFGHINKSDDGKNDIGLEKIGTGTLRLGGANTYSRHTYISGGVLEVIGAGTLGAGGYITFKGGTLAYGDGAETPYTIDYSDRIAKSTTAPISVDTKSNSITWATALAASNTAGLTKKGSGTLTPSARWRGRASAVPLMSNGEKGV